MLYCTAGEAMVDLETVLSLKTFQNTKSILWKFQVYLGGPTLMTSNRKEFIGIMWYELPYLGTCLKFIEYDK